MDDQAYEDKYVWVSKFLRTQFSTTIDMMVTQNKLDSEVIDAPGFFVTTEKPDEKIRRLYLDKEMKGKIAYYLYQKCNKIDCFRNKYFI